MGGVVLVREVVMVVIDEGVNDAKGNNDEGIVC